MATTQSTTQSTQKLYNEPRLTKEQQIELPTLGLARREPHTALPDLLNSMNSMNATNSSNSRNATNVTNLPNPPNIQSNDHSTPSTNPPPSNTYEVLYYAGKFNPTANVTTLKYIGPFYQKTMAGAGIVTIRDLVAHLCKHASSGSTICNSIAKLAHNERAGIVVKAKPIPQCNSRVCLTMSELLAFAMRHPDLFADIPMPTLPISVVDTIVARFREFTTLRDS